MFIFEEMRFNWVKLIQIKVKSIFSFRIFTFIKFTSFELR